MKECWDALLKPVPLLLFVDNADVLVELEESLACGGKANNFIGRWAFPECLDEKPELVLQQGKGG